MSTITLPALEVGDTLTTAMTTTPPADLLVAAAALGSGNLGKESIDFRNVDWTAVSPFQYSIYSEYGGDLTQTLGSTSFVPLTHGSFDTSNFTPGVTVVGPCWLVARFRFRVKEITVHSASIANDYYYAKFSYSWTNGGGGTSDAYPLGYSMCVRNSGGTLTADTPISSSTFDVKNKIQGIWREAAVPVYIPAGTTRALSNFSWTLALGDADHDVVIDRYAVAFDIWYR